MGDEGEYWRESRERKERLKRDEERRNLSQLNKHKSELVAKAVTIAFAQDRIRFTKNKVKYDWWPTTGTWREVTGAGPQGTGYKKLFQILLRG